MVLRLTFRLTARAYKSATGCPQTVLSPNGDEPVRVRPAVLRLTFHAIVIGLCGCSHISYFLKLTCLIAMGLLECDQLSFNGLVA